MEREQQISKFDTLEKRLSSPSILRICLIGAMILLQGITLGVLISFLNQYMTYYYVATIILLLVVMLYIFSNKANPAFKLTWMFIVAISPIYGSIVYIFLGSDLASLRTRKQLERVSDKIVIELSEEKNLVSEVEDAHIKNQMQYLINKVGCPAYANTRVDFLSPGEVKFERLKAELRKAKSFIFLEYFIIGSGIMWEGILEILADKVREGIEVRVMWDDFGSMTTIPSKHGEYLTTLGIKNCVFNKVVPILSGLHNHRDHRKIAVIDGKVAFTGGINLADEYINAYEKLGHWKDSSIVLEGEAVWSFTVMFLSTWSFVNNSDEDYSRYRRPAEEIAVKDAAGLIQPYYDSPLDSELVGENVYMNMISRAERYIYMESPYLVIDHEMLITLSNAARQGVDVRIITPHIGDHWYVHSMTRSNYSQLIEAGVRIFEYTPGFIHSKIFICDDKIATVGTINMDYRSLYLHFECGAMIYDSPVLDDIYDDFLDVQSVSHEVALEETRVSPARRLMRSIIRIFSPMM